MPHSGTCQPTAERQDGGELKVPERRGVVDPQAARYHDPQCDEINPVRKTDDERVMVFLSRRHGSKKIRFTHRAWFQVKSLGFVQRH